MVVIGPIQAEIGDSQVVLRFGNAQDLHLAVPPDLEKELADFADGRRADIQGKELIFDLESVCGLTSRHLGIMVTAHKAFQSYGGCRLRGLSPEIKRLLEVTRLLQLFPGSEA